MLLSEDDVLEYAGADVGEATGVLLPGPGVVVEPGVTLAVGVVPGVTVGLVAGVGVGVTGVEVGGTGVAPTAVGTGVGLPPETTVGVAGTRGGVAVAVGPVAEEPGASTKDHSIERLVAPSCATMRCFPAPQFPSRMVAVNFPCESTRTILG